MRIEYGTENVAIGGREWQDFVALNVLEVYLGALAIQCDWRRNVGSSAERRQFVTKGRTYRSTLRSL